MTAVNTAIVTDAQRQQFADEGYFILERVIPEAHLDILRSACDYFIADMDRRMDARGVTTMGITHKGSRYFVGLRYNERPEMRRFLFADYMAEICRATLGDDAYLFYDQFVWKGPDKVMRFGWHQDSGYVGYPHKPYLTCWCPLVDVDEVNGTVYVLPYSRAGVRSMVQHIPEPGSNDRVGYFGADPGVPAVIPAGSIVVFSSVVFHRSGANTTPNPRPVYVAQYSSQVIANPTTGRLQGLAEPFLRRGRCVVRQAV